MRTYPHPLVLQARHERERRGLAQIDIAAAINVDRTLVAKWETGARTPTLGHLTAYAAAVGLTLTFTANQEGQIAA